MDACDIDTLRELIARQHSAKHRFFSPEFGMGYSGALDPVDVERQLVTYLNAGTTVDELTKCVEAAEQEAKERVERERAEHEARERKYRILRVCEAALTGPANVYLKGHYRRTHTLERDVATIKKEIGDPYA